MRSFLRHLAGLCQAAAFLLGSGAADGAIVNQASAQYADPVRGSQRLQSNAVSARMPEIIAYYTDANYSMPARVTSTASLLFVQARASACNADPTLAETIELAIRTDRAGASMTVEAVETAPDSGVFRSTPWVLASEDAANGAPATSGAVYAMQNDTITASIRSCGDHSAWTSIMVDPSGMAFDSATGAPVAGARVTLIDVSGAGNGGLPGGPARVLARDGVTELPASAVTDARGRYDFPLVLPSLYRLAVVPPAEYAYPSRAAPATLSPARDIHLHGSFGASFTVSGSLGPVAIDLPLDTRAGTLYLEKSASRAHAEVGDVVDYTIRVHNSAGQVLRGVVVDDALPAGFRYQAGTLRIDGAPAEPAGAAGAALRIAVGEVAASGMAVLRYRVRIGAGALQGDGINRARATSGAPLALSSGTAAARVKVDAGVFGDKAYLAGQVFADCDGDRLRGAGEAGIPGVRIWLEDGSFAVTDGDGRYSFADVLPRTHAARLDPLSLPHAAVAADAAPRFIDLQDGQLGKADFAVAACTPALRAAVAARAAALLAAARRSDAPAARQPAAVAAADVATLDNALGFAGLADGDVLPLALANIRVKGVAGARFAMFVNGRQVADERIGQRSSVAERQLESWEYVGVALQPGRNRLELRQFDGFGNPRGSHAIAVTAPGAAARLRIETDKAAYPADGRTLALVRVRVEDAAGIAVAERTPVTLQASLGSWKLADLDPGQPGVQVFIEGGAAQFALLAPAAAGDAQLGAASGALAGQAVLSFVPALRPLLATGVVDAAVGVGRSRGNTTAPARSFDSLDDSLRQLARGLESRDRAASGRAAVFMKGAVAGDTLLTLAYDTDRMERDPSQALFRDPAPDAYYPAYGDDAVRGIEAQSAGRLYLRAERNKSWLAHGDFTPPAATAARQLGAYQRSLNGLRQHAELGSLVVDSFASYTSTRQLVEEIAANGTSGPYLSGSGAMVINSERVEIVTRDRNRGGVVLASRPQVRYLDYDVEPLTGRILFRAPVASLDADLNPVSVRISYEVDQGHPKFWVAGATAQWQVAPYLALGAGVALDRNPAQPQALSSVSATFKPDERTTLIVEAARLARSGRDRGHALRLDAVRNDGALESRVFAGRADEAFDNPAASLPRGRSEAGARLRYRLDQRAALELEALRTADALTGAARNGVLVGASYAFASGLRLEAGVRRAHEQAGAGVLVAQPDLTSVRIELGAQVPGLPQAGVFVEAEQDIKDSARRVLAVGGDYRFAGGSRAYARHELISSLGSNYALNEGQQRQATVVGIDSDYMQGGRVFSEYRARGELGQRQAEATIGLRNLWQVAEGVRAHTSFERVHVLAGAQANEAVAITGALEVSRNPVWKGNARLELRHAADSDALLSTLGLARRLDSQWSLLAKNTLAATRSRAGGSLRLNETLQGGLAYRALETLGWNGIAKLEFKRERDTGPADLERGVHMVALNANWQPSQATLFSARYAAKLARDRSQGLDSRTRAQLFGARATRSLGADWDLGVSAQALVDGGRGMRGGRQYGAGIEAGYRLRADLWLSAGYNALGFRERDLAGADATQKGVFLRLRMKFDERLLEGLLAPTQ